MATFLHNLMEGLRGREKFLEEKLGSSTDLAKENDPYLAECKSLQADLDAFKKRLSDLQAKGEDYDEHFERKITDDHRELEVRIDSWAKSWETRH